MSARVLLLMTARPEFESPWIGRPEVTQLALHPLTRQQMAEMAASVAGGELPPDVVQQVVSRTDGVPLFVEELTRTLLESEQLDAAGAEQEQRVDEATVEARKTIA